MQQVMQFGARKPALAATGLRQTLVIFGGASALLFVATHGLIPMLSRVTGQEALLCWFLVGGLGVFLPLLILAGLLLHAEGAAWGRGLWVGRLRFHPMNRGDWWWSVAALLPIGVASAGVSTIVGPATQPPFMSFAPLTASRSWLLAIWLPFWVLNIMSEEILWRGVLLPRQERTFGRWAWLANSGGWFLFHLAFGWRMLILLLPILVIEPYVVQRRQNSWVGVLIHAACNGPAFLAIAFGML